MFLPTLLLSFQLISCCAAALSYKGYDISSLLLEESNGITYQDTAGKTAPLESIIAGTGATSAKIRLWVNPADGVYNLTYALGVGKRVAAAGLGVQLNIHYSDTWADPGNQDPPTEWASMGIDDLVSAVSTYTTDVVGSFVDAGITPEIVSVGNEIRAGILWPLGKYDQMSNLARLLNAGAAAVRAESADSLVMLHTDQGYNWDTQKWFYSDLVDAGLDLSGSVDVLGVSYYPFWDAELSTLDNFKTTITNMASTFGKKVMVQETDWPTQCSDSSDIPNSLKSEFSFDTAGQTAWVEKVSSIVEGVSGGLGLMYWEPGWVSNTALGSPCESNTMFTAQWGNGGAVSTADDSLMAMEGL